MLSLLSLLLLKSSLLKIISFSFFVVSFVSVGVLLLLLLLVEYLDICICIGAHLLTMDKRVAGGERRTVFSFQNKRIMKQIM